MNTQLKKGDRCQSRWGDLTIEEIENNICLVTLPKLGKCTIHMSDLLRIPTHAERMQKIVDTAFDAENRYQNDEHITVRVGELAEFVRHYLAIRAALEKAVDDTTQRILDAEEAVEKTKKLLNARAMPSGDGVADESKLKSL